MLGRLPNGQKMQPDRFGEFLMVTMKNGLQEGDHLYASVSMSLVEEKHWCIHADSHADVLFACS